MGLVLQTVTYEPILFVLIPYKLFATELQERNAGEDSGTRMAPALPPNKQVLNKLARENAQLKLALNRLMGKGVYGYQEGLVSLLHLHDSECFSLYCQQDTA